jgi:hypothetical protein
VLALLASAILAPNLSANLSGLKDPLAYQAATPAQDPSAPLRQFPVSIMVHRPGADVENVSLLRLTALQPKDEILVRVGDKLTKDWTLATAYLSAGQKVHVQTWNLWDKRWRTHPMNAGKVPEGDVVPLFFLVLNRTHDGRVQIAIQKALEASSEQIVSASAVFESTYQQQNRLYEFLSAYAALGPKVNGDPVLLRNRIYSLDADMGYTVNPGAPPTTPGDMQRGLDATVGLLNELRKDPDGSASAAQAVQDQLPTPVADWFGLVSDLMRLVIHPRSNLKVSFIPASSSEVLSGNDFDDSWMELVTERVPQPTDGSVAALVYRPPYERTQTTKPPVLRFQKAEVVAGPREVGIPLAPDSRDLFTHPMAWDWEFSDDGVSFQPLQGAKLLPGQGLVFPIQESWWDGGNERDLTIRARVGFTESVGGKVKIARLFPQEWALESGTEPDLAVGDSSAKVVVTRSGGTPQPFYNVATASLTDSAGKVFPAQNINYNGTVSAWFDLANVSPGEAKIRVIQDPSAPPDAPVSVFIAPKRPNISVFYATGDKVVRIAGPDAGMVTSVSGPKCNSTGVQPGASGTREFALSAAAPDGMSAVEVTYADPAHPGLSWKRVEPIAVGLPRPKMVVNLVGTLPEQVFVGAGPDPSWAVATMPPGWFRTSQPIRVELDGVAPYRWSHDVAIALGFGPQVDVQQALQFAEGPNLAIDLTNPTASLTLDIDTMVPATVPRNTGLVWVQATRQGLASPWTLATLSGSQQDVALRAVKLPIIQSVATDATKTRITFIFADQLQQIKLAGQPTLLMPQLITSTPQTGLSAYVDAPAGTSEFDMQIRDAPEAMVHVKIVKPQ